MRISPPAWPREVREECGLEAAITGVAGVSELDMPTVRVVLLCMFARVTGGDLRLSEEHDAYEWVPFSEMLKRPLIQSMKPVIRQLSQP